MTTFDKREEGFEQQFVHDEEPLQGDRAPQQAPWPVGRGKVGLTGTDAENYAKSVVMADFEETGDHDVLGKIRNDFDAKGVAQSDHQISRRMTELMGKAVADIKAGR
jgi:hypothetical protein